MRVSGFKAGQCFLVALSESQVVTSYILLIDHQAAVVLGK